MSTPPVIREIDVRRQHRMSLRETWTLCIRGVKHRLFRSALTLAVVVLAVAFFMFLLCDSNFSLDQASTATGSVITIRQRSIQTPYNLTRSLEENILKLAKPNAGKQIADECLKLCKGFKKENGSKAASNAPVSKEPENVYFIGIGGIGMSALARYYKSRGCAVSGYDRTPSALTRALEQLRLRPESCSVTDGKAYLTLALRPKKLTATLQSIVDALPGSRVEELS